MQGLTPIGLSVYKAEFIRKLDILSQDNTLEILVELNKHPLHMKALAEKTGVPYTTVQKRINDLEMANLVQTVKEVDENTGKSIKKVRVTRFHIELNMKTINRIMNVEKNIVLEAI